MGRSAQPESWLRRSRVGGWPQSMARNWIFRYKENHRQSRVSVEVADCEAHLLTLQWRTTRCRRTPSGNKGWFRATIQKQKSVTQLRGEYGNQPTESP